MSDSPSQDNKAIAKIAAAGFGGRWGVSAYGDAGDTSTLDVLHSRETPEQGLASFCTIGLSDTSLSEGRLQLPLGVELVGTSNHDDFAEVLATAGFFVLKDGWIPKPDTVFEEIVSEHFEGVTTPHLLLVPPYLWPDLPSSRELTTKTVAFVMVVPITEAESAYFSECGADALGRALEESDPDIVDLWRASVV